MSAHVYLNGRIVPVAEAVLPADDRAVLFGDAAYETMRSYGGRFFRFSEHLARLHHTLAGLRLDLGVPDAEITRGALSVVEANGVPDARVRLTVTGGRHDGNIRLRRGNPANVILTAAPLAPPSAETYRAGVKVVFSRWTVPSDSPLPRLKTVNRLVHLMAKEEALEKDAWEALFLDESGHLLEGTATNVFFVVDGVLRTASLAEPILAGVTRDAVLQEARAEGLAVREGFVTVAEATQASEAFLTSTTTELLPIRQLINQPVGASERPVWRALARRFRATVCRETGVAVGELPGT